jgi:biotin-(acetyl-CoA carboxylase) ligase
MLRPKCIRRKVAGTLIENYCFEEKSWWLVGIGINIESSPSALPPEKDDFRQVPRTATCLREHAKIGYALPAPAEFGLDLALRLQELCNDFGRGESSGIVEKWKLWADIGSTYELRETGERVITLGLESDGQLRILGQDGKERLLLADYLF